MTRKLFNLKKIVLLSMLMIFASSGLVEAVTTGKISGQIVDSETSTPLQGANVMIEGTVYGAASDESGEYFIIGVPPGMYDVRVSMMGYETTIMTMVRVMANRTTPLNFTLNTAVIEGSQVTVVAERELVELDVTGTQTIMNSANIEMAPVQDLEDLLSQQNGIINTGMVSTFRGGELKEVNYMVDGNSTQYGVMQDQVRKVNTTAIEEVSLLTGGYNAEYGNAMSGVVNVVTKEAPTTERNIQGSMNVTYRPAGQYHWGGYLFDENLHRIGDFPLSYWQEQLQSESKQAEYAEYYRYWYGWDGETVPTAEQLLETHLDQTLGNQEVMDYNQRSQKEFEGTVYGSFAKNTNFLASINYLRGVHIYPTRLPYQDSYNGIFKFNYYIDSNKKLSFNYMHSGHKMSAYNQAAVTSTENNRVLGLQPAESRDPNDQRLGKYGYYGGDYRLGNNELDMNQFTASWTHTLSPSTFYNVDVTYTRSKNIIAQDYSIANEQNAWADEHFGYTENSPWPRDGYVGYAQFDRQWSLTGELRVMDMNWLTNFGTESNALKLKGDITSQITKNHQIKSGAEFILHDLDYIASQHDWRGTTNDDPYGGQVFQNIWDAKPTEVGLYIQDKMEYEGIILNIGIRLDAYNANTTYPENPLFDPFVVQPTTQGYEENVLNSDYIWFLNRGALPDWVYWPMPYEDYSDLSGKPGYDEYTLKSKNTVNSTWKMAISPRLGISFPITDASKVFFSYGHFHMRPSFSAICGRPISYKRQDPLNTIGPNRQFGYTGHDGLTYQKLVQFELGYNHNIMEKLLLSATFYYKDYEKLTNLAYKSPYGEGGISVGGNSQDGASMYVWPTEIGRGSFHSGNNVLANKGFRESRGVEMGLEKVFNGLWSAGVNMDYGVTAAANYGFTGIQESVDKQSSNSVGSQAKRDDIKSNWMSDLRVRANASIVTPHDFAGPAAMVLGDITFSVYHEYFKGPKYTWYDPSFTGLRVPDNKVWYPHQRTDIKITKNFNLGKINPYLSLQVINLFNNYDRILLSGSELDAWELNGEVPIESKENAPNYWKFYNSYSNPRRMIYFTTGIEF